MPACKHSNSKMHACTRPPARVCKYVPKCRWACAYRAAARRLGSQRWLGRARRCGRRWPRGARPAAVGSLAVWTSATGAGGGSRRVREAVGGCHVVSWWPPPPQAASAQCRFVCGTGVHGTACQPAASTRACSADAARMQYNAVLQLTSGPVVDMISSSSACSRVSSACGTGGARGQRHTARCAAGRVWVGECTCSRVSSSLGQGGGGATGQRHKTRCGTAWVGVTRCGGRTSAQPPVHMYRTRHHTWTWSMVVVDACRPHAT